MEKKSSSVNHDPRVKDVFEHLRSELARAEETKKPKDDVPPPPVFSVDLRIDKEDMNKYKVQSSSPKVAINSQLKFLGFKDGMMTQIFVRDKKVRLSPKPKGFQTLGRSWFKQGLTEEEQRASVYKAKKEEKKEDDADRFIAKEMLHQFLKQAKARTRIAGKQGEKVDEKPICSTSARSRGKKKANVRRLSEIMSDSESCVCDD